MRGIAGLLGLIAVWGYVIALLNYFMKYINKKYINKIPKEKEQYKKMYRFIMRYVVRYHKVAGAIASIAVILHLCFMYTFVGISVPGLLAGTIMLIVFVLGLYGTFINKNVGRAWVKVHRALAFILIAFIGFHVIFSKVLLIHL